MLYRILRELGSLDTAKREAAIRMARGLPWEDLEQLLGFFDKSRTDARKGMWMIIAILLLMGSCTVFLFGRELKVLHPATPFIAACLVGLLPIPVILQYSASKRRAESGLSTIFEEMDDPAFVAVGLGILSEAAADNFSFRPELLKVITRLLPDVTIEQCRDWTVEERYTLSQGLSTVLPLTAGGRDALSHSPYDYSLVILKVLQQVGDAREVDLVRLVSTIDPITENHQRIREAATKCLKTIEKRIHEAGPNPAPHIHVVPAAPTPPPRPNRTEVDLSHWLKQSPRKRQPASHDDQP